MKRSSRFASTSLLVALGSIVALGAQALLGLAMLRFFTPHAAGGFAVIAQMGFFWVILSLSQGHLQLLADAHRPAGETLRTVLRSSLWRWLCLLPLVGLAAWLSDMAAPVIAVSWAALLALLQLTWYLAQPWVLRTATPAAAAMVRAAPPVVALVLTVTAARAWPADSPHGLLVAAACGYGVGALWLLSAGRPPSDSSLLSSTETPAVAQADSRSAGLRLAHTATDAVVGAALLLVWQRLYGLTDASYLAMLQRLLGFIPVIVHTAWTQVLLAHVQRARWRSLAIGTAGAAAVSLSGWMGSLVLDKTTLAVNWLGMGAYILPVVLWQASTCLSAALSHRPFQHERENQLSWLAIGLQCLQVIVLTAPFWTPWNWTTQSHLWWLAGTSAAGQLALTAWMMALPLRRTRHH